MSDPISFSPFLGWVDATDPDNIPVDVRIIGASDLLRYENFAVAAKNKINLESVRVDDEIERIDALVASAGSMVRKTADTTRSSTTTLANDSTLAFTIEANELVEVTAVLYVTSPTAADFAVAFTGAALASGRWGVHGDATGGTNPSGVSLTIATDNSKQQFVLHGLLGAGASGGTVALQWAQGTSDAGATTLHSFSYLKTAVVE